MKAHEKASIEAAILTASSLSAYSQALVLVGPGYGASPSRDVTQALELAVAAYKKASDAVRLKLEHENAFNAGEEVG